MAEAPNVADLRAFADELLLELSRQYPMGYVPHLQWKGMRVSAGMAYYKTGRIALSSRVLFDRDSVRDTLIHEYAHLLAVHRHGRKGAGHGAAWREAMREMGLEPRVRHTYRVERNRRRQEVTYKCAGCGKLYVRGRRFPGRARYYHLHCGGEFKLVQIQRITSNDAVS